MKVGLTIALLSLTPLSFAQFKFAPISVPGAFATQARGINADGEIVGFYETVQNCNNYTDMVPNCPTHGFKYLNGEFIKLGVPNAIATAMTAVNDNGDIVGFYTRSDGTMHGFLWLHTNVVKTIDYPKTTYVTVPMGINNALTIVGGLWQVNSNGTFAEGGWVWSKGKFSNMNLGTQGCLNCTSVNGISNNGIIVGQAFRNDFWTGFLKEGSDNDFFRYNTVDTYATGVNSATDIVGWGAGGAWLAENIEANEGIDDARENNPSFIAVQYPGANVTEPYSLNKSRAIVGAFWDSRGQSQQGFIAKPSR